MQHCFRESRGGVFTPRGVRAAPPDGSLLLPAAFPAAEGARADLLFPGEAAERRAAAAPDPAEGPLQRADDPPVSCEGERGRGGGLRKASGRAPGFRNSPDK